MRQRVLVIGLALAPLALTGCSKPKSWFHAKAGQSTPVAVRFVMPAWPEQFAGTWKSEWQWQQESTAAESGYTEATLTSGGTSGFAGDAKPADPNAYHVALWGGPFGGQDVTHSLTPLNPGNYTFAFFDQDQPAAAQGWIQVNHGGNELIDILQRWKAEIPQQKNWFAYDFELKGKLDGKDQQSFRSFAKQLRAFDRLERQLDWAIESELRNGAWARQRYNQFFSNAEVLMLPGGEGVFHPTTQPAFDREDVQKVWDGDSVSKVLLVADYPTIEWKLEHVNQVYGDFARCKAVLMEEADRLQRRKRFYTLTDHIYHHDHKFVQNEMRLQLAYTAIDRINEQMGQLSQRRMGLAFVNELFSQDGSWRWLEQEQQSLQRERTVLETQKRQIDLFFEQAAEPNLQKVAFERNRQEVNAALSTIDQQLEQLSDARLALQGIRSDSEVIHRQGDTHILATSLVSAGVPFHVRQAVEKEAFMSVRIEESDHFFTPAGYNETRLQKVSSPYFPHGN